ncbi:MAG TPA: hypothetical protein GX507_02880 [Clostridia bacterium]|nr:hypothetical protein [Clostridia bacterium]
MGVDGGSLGEGSRYRGPWISLVTSAFYPTETFGGLASAGRMPILPPVLVFALGMMAFTLLNLEEIIAIVSVQISASSDLPPEAAGAALRFAKVSAVVGSAAGVLGFFLVGLVLGFIGLFLGSPASLRQLFSLAGYSMTFPLLLQSAIRAVMVRVFPSLTPQTVLTSAALLLPPESAGTFTYGLLSGLDLFGVWVLAVMVVGYSRLTGFSTKKAATVLITLWVAFLLGGAALSTLAPAVR